jgi:DNA modification methylase
MTEKDTTYSSIWLFRKNRNLCNGTKDPIANMKNFRQVRGKYFSEFNPTIAENIINFWSNEDDLILDPFAGRTRCFISSKNNRRYIGFEISKQVTDKINILIKQPKLEEVKYQPCLYNMDSFNMDTLKLPQVDLIFTCPPYWNLETYESCDGQLSDIKDYNNFLLRYKEIMKKSIELLKEDKYMCLVVGDFRKNKKYYTFHIDNIKIMEELGLKLHDIILIQSVTFDIANKRFGMFKKHKFTSKVHEYLLVFKKCSFNINGVK